MYWFLSLIFLLFVIHYCFPLLVVRLAQIALRLLYRLKVYLIRRRRAELEQVLLQIEQDKQWMREEEQNCRRLLAELEDEEQKVNNYAGRYIEIEK
jgi:hypothetical protein